MHSISNESIQFRSSEILLNSNRNIKMEEFSNDFSSILRDIQGAEQESSEFIAVNRHFFLDCVF